MLKPRRFANHRLDGRPKSADAICIRAHPLYPWFLAAFAVLLVAEPLAAEAVTATGTVEAVDAASFKRRPS